MSDIANHQRLRLSQGRRNRLWTLTYFRKYTGGEGVDNSTIALQAIGKPRAEIEETALPLNGKKHNLTRRDWLSYFGRDRLKLTRSAIESCLEAIRTVFPQWLDLVEISFLSEDIKRMYSEVLRERLAVMALD